MARVARHGFVHRHGVGVAALALFGATSFLYLGLRLFLVSGPHYVGYRVDPQIFIWAFAWWPHAILHGENPLITPAIWAPHGVNLSWSTSVPGLALAFAPLTLLLGPVTSYNIAAILLPAMAAWTAFLLCRHLTRSTFASLVGGYLFGFSSYLLGQEEGHPHMSAVFLLPLIALLLVQYVQGALHGGALIVRLGPALAFEVLISTEVSLTLALALLVGVCVAYATFATYRHRLIRLLAPLGAAYAVAALLTGPFDYFVVTGSKPTNFPDPSRFVTDLLNFVVPTRLALLSFGWTERIASSFPGNTSEQGAYLGVPVLVIIVLVAISRPWADATTFLIATLGLATLATVGAELTIDGRWVVSMPWVFVSRLPFLDDVLPERLSVYVWLVTAVLVARWTAESRQSRLRVIIPGLAILAVFPNPNAGVWTTSFAVPRFFTDASYRSCLRPGETVLPLPVSSTGSSMLWQTYDDFRFRLAGGYIAPVPPRAFLHPREIALIAEGEPGGDSTKALELYIRTEHVGAVIVAQNDETRWRRALAPLARPLRTGGVFLYDVSAGAPRCHALT